LSKDLILDLATKCRFHTPAALPPAKNPGTHSMGGLVGPRVGLNVVRKGKVRKRNTEKSQKGRKDKK
jgi:hypothetical protein